MEEQEQFPVSDYYQGHVLEGETLSKIGVWWSAILLIREPKTQRPFVCLYRWQKTAAGWKVRKRYSFNSARDLNRALNLLQRLLSKMGPGEEGERANACPPTI